MPGVSKDVRPAIRMTGNTPVKAQGEGSSVIPPNAKDVFIDHSTKMRASVAGTEFFTPGRQSH